MIFNVTGMTCGGCAKAITKAIERLDPQATVKVDVSGGKVSVSSDAPMTKIAEVIEAAGFEAKPA